MKTLMDPAQRAKQLQRLEHLHPQTKPLWGLLTAGDLLPHLTDPFKIAMGEMEAIPVESFFLTGLGKFAAIFLMPRWPKGAPTHPKTNIQIEGRKGADFQADKRELIETMVRFIDHYPIMSYYSHPIFGELSNKTWAIVMNKHLDHHFRQFNL
jgi:hypothetical protein